MEYVINKKTGKKKVIRHGEVHLFLIKSLPKGLKKSSSSIVMKGSGGHNHDTRNCTFYPKAVNRWIFGYLEAKKGAVLLHVQHGNKNLPKIDGMWQAPLKHKYYELKVSNEIIQDEMRLVID